MDEVYHPLDRPTEDAESLSRFLKQRIRMGYGLRQVDVLGVMGRDI